MKKFIVLLILSMITKIASSQSECVKFATGKFQNIENGELAANIERNDSIQIEQHGEIIIKLKIEWLDECSYRLTFLEGNEAYWESNLRHVSNPDLIVKILSIEGNSFFQESRFVGDDDFIYKSTIVKIE